MLNSHQTTEQARSDAFADFAYCLLHDISAPMRQTKSFASLAVRETNGDLTPAQRRRLGQITWAVARGEVLLEGLHRASMALSKPLSDEVCDTGELLNSAIALSSGASLRGDFRYEQGPLGPVRTDRQVFIAALEGILTRLFNCTPDPTRPTPRIECLARDEAWILRIADHPGQPSAAHLALSQQLLGRLGGEIVRAEGDERSLEIRLPPGSRLP